MMTKLVLLLPLLLAGCMTASLAEHQFARAIWARRIGVRQARPAGTMPSAAAMALARATPATWLAGPSLIPLAG